MRAYEPLSRFCVVRRWLREDGHPPGSRTALGMTTGRGALRLPHLSSVNIPGSQQWERAFMLKLNPMDR